MVRTRSGRIQKLSCQTATGRDALQLFVDALVGEIQRVDDARDRLDAHEVARRGVLARRGLRRINHDGAIVGAKHHVQPLRFAPQRHRRLAARVADEIAEHIVELERRQLNGRGVGKELLDRLRHARGHLCLRHRPMRSGRDRERPFIARRIGELKERMETDSDRHRLDAQVVDPRRHFQHAVAKAVGHLDGVRKRKLLHPRRMPEEFQPARDPGRLPIGARLRRPSSRGPTSEIRESGSCRERCPGSCRTRIACRWRKTPARRAGRPTARGMGCQSILRRLCILRPI